MVDFFKHGDFFHRSLNIYGSLMELLFRVPSTYLVVLVFYLWRISKGSFIHGRPVETSKLSFIYGRLCIANRLFREDMKKVSLQKRPKKTLEVLQNFSMPRRSEEDFLSLEDLQKVFYPQETFRRSITERTIKCLLLLGDFQMVFHS